MFRKSLWNSFLLLAGVLCAGLAWAGVPDTVLAPKPDTFRTALADSGSSWLRSFVILPGTGRLIGRVTDAVTGQGLPGTSVTFIGKKFGDTTIFDGSYVIFNIPKGRYSVRAASGGFHSVTRKGVWIAADSVTRQDFILK